MKAEVKKAWVEALRSGEYKQISGGLKIGDRFCCLGVLCDISELAEWEGGGYLKTAGVLPHPVMRWAGLNDQDPEMKGTFATTWNDVHGKSFSEIADLIEEFL